MMNFRLFTSIYLFKCTWNCDEIYLKCHSIDWFCNLLFTPQHFSEQWIKKKFRFGEWSFCESDFTFILTKKNVTQKIHSRKFNTTRNFQRNEYIQMQSKRLICERYKINMFVMQRIDAKMGLPCVLFLNCVFHASHCTASKSAHTQV